MLKLSFSILLTAMVSVSFAQIDDGQGEVFINTYNGFGTSVGTSYYGGYDVDQTVKFAGTAQLNMFGSDTARVISPYNIFVGGQVNVLGSSLLVQIGDKGRYNMLLTHKANRFFINGGLSNGLRLDRMPLIKIGGGITLLVDTQSGGAYCYNSEGDFNKSISLGMNLFKWGDGNDWSYNLHVSYLF